MYFLFLLTGVILGAIVPVFNFQFLSWRGSAYYWALFVFGIVVLAFLILSIYKFQMSKYDYLASCPIVSWNIEHKKTDKTDFPKFAYAISLFAGVLFGTGLLLSSVGLLNSILLGLSCAFIVLGLWQLGFTRLTNKKNSLDSFFLSHIGIIYNNKIEVFNGYTKGILSAKEENGKLLLTILKGKKEEFLCFDIPKEKLNDVLAFLDDLNKFLAGNENGEE